MIKIIPSLLLASVLTINGVSATEIHVATNGDDKNPGTKELPFASIRRAQQEANPGDTVLIHGGVYQMKESDIAARDGFLASILSITKEGAKGRPIRYQAAPGESRPVLDCSKVTPAGLRVSAIRVHASWVEIVGLEITGVKVNARDHTQSVCVENLGSHNLFENLSMHDGEAIGLYITRGSDNTVLNCDAYRNHDRTSENGRGGNTDGFGCHPRSKQGENNVFKGCRAWFNSDDGFDCINAPCPVTFENCWAFYNGFSTDFKPLADGNGFKAGGYGITPGTIFPDPVPRHRVIHCLSVRNRSNGFYANHHPGGIDWIDNTACLNPTNFNFLCRNSEGTADIPGRGHRIIGNLSFRSKRGILNLDEAGNEVTGNAFDVDSEIKDEDFSMIDESHLTAPRKPNGDLPEIRFKSPLVVLGAAGRQTGEFIKIGERKPGPDSESGPLVADKVSPGSTSPPSGTLPASSSASERCRSYLSFAGRDITASPLGKINNKSALRLPGLLASIVDVKDQGDPRLARFMDETCRILKGLHDSKSRLGPFEIYFPIANHVAAKRILGSTLTSHPAYKAYEAAVFEHQCLWADYRSNGSDPPKSPIRDAKTLADVSENIDNGNFRLLVTAAGYLSAQEFPNLKTTSKDPKTGTERVFTRDLILREMDLYIRRVYHSITTRNTSEYGSQTYLAIDFAPVRMIAEYANDPEIKQIATRTLDWFYTSLAACWNQGHYINSAARSKGEFLGTRSGMGFLGWLAFDTGRPTQGNTTPFCIYLALPGAYKLPPAIRPHESFPFVKRETIGGGNNPVAVYTYQSKSFGLTNSIESRNPSGRSNPKWDRDGFYKEAARHKLNWFGPKSGGFSPQWQNSAQPYAGRRNQVNGRYYGLNPWSTVIQCRGTQIGLANVREEYPFRKLYVSYPLDGSIQERIHKAESGWTLCHTGNMIFAFRSLKAPTLGNDPKVKGFITDWYDYKKTAWILESVEVPKSGVPKSQADISAEIEKFHKTLLSSKTESTHLDDADRGSPTISYTSPVSGRTLILDAAVYPIPADGEGVPISRYPLLATYPDDKSAPRILQEKDKLLWLDGSGQPKLTYHFQLPEK